MHISSHEFAPTMGDPGTCGVGNCGEPWSHELHNPARLPKWGGTPESYHVLQPPRISAEWGPNPACPHLNHSQTCPTGCAKIDEEVQGVRLGQPKCPVGDCPLTHPHLHPRSGAVEPDPVFDNIEVVTPPHRFAMKTVRHMMTRSIENADYCANCDCLIDNADLHPEWRPIRCAYVAACSDLTFDRPSFYADHALKAHGFDNWQVMEYLQDPWLVGEPRTEWKDRNFGRFYGRAEITPVTTEINIDTSSLRNALRNFGLGMRPPISEEAPMSDTEKMARELGEWWMELASDEVDKVVPKAVEYGALDLIDIGQDLARAAGRKVSDEEAAEMGVYFYIRGKLARWTDALVRNDRPSDDTLHDLGVYVRMAQRIRATGAWPGVSDTD